MDERDTFIRADRHLLSVIERITDDQWGTAVPEHFDAADDRTYTVREILDYIAYDEAWVPAMVAGRRMEDVGADAFGEPFGGDLLGDAPKDRFRELSAAAMAVVEGLSEADLDDRTVHFSYGEFPAREALRHIASFRGLRAYDLADALGLDTTMPDELVAGLWDMLEPRIDEYRAAGVFPPAVEVEQDAPLQDRLLALTGRQP